MAVTEKTKEYVLDTSPIKEIIEKARENAKRKDLEFKKMLANALLRTYPDRDEYVVNDKGLIDYVGQQKQKANAKGGD